MIELAPGVTTRRLRDPDLAWAPRAIGARAPYARLLASAGFTDVVSRDVTDAYRVTVGAWLRAATPVRDELAAVDGAAAVDERLGAWRGALASTADGTVRRTLYSARRPPRRGGA